MMAHAAHPTEPTSYVFNDPAVAQISVPCDTGLLTRVGFLLGAQEISDPVGTIVEPRKLEHGCRRISARIPYTLP